MLVMDQNLERQDSSMIITFLLLPPSSSFLLVSPWSLEVTARDSFEPDSCPESPLVRELKIEAKLITACLRAENRSTVNHHLLES